MRILVELLIAAGLVAAAWQTPYRERLGQVIPSLAEKPSGTKSRQTTADNEQQTLASPQPAVAKAPGPPANSNWMWDPKRPGSLDRPGQTPPPPTEFTKHIYYTDEKGKKYWLDAQGKRHYD